MRFGYFIAEMPSRIASRHWLIAVLIWAFAFQGAFACDQAIARPVKEDMQHCQHAANMKSATGDHAMSTESPVPASDHHGSKRAVDDCASICHPSVIAAALPPMPTSQLHVIFVSSLAPQNLTGIVGSPATPPPRKS